MTTSRDSRPSFIVTHEAWYRESVPRLDQPEIMIGWYSDDDTNGWEFAIRWITLQNRPYPRVEIFDEAWAAFTDPTMGTLFSWLAQNRRGPTPDQVKAALLELGFVDRTPREHKD